MPSAASSEARSVGGPKAQIKHLNSGKDGSSKSFQSPLHLLAPEFDRELSDSLIYRVRRLTVVWFGGGRLEKNLDKLADDRKVSVRLVFKDNRFKVFVKRLRREDDLGVKPLITTNVMLFTGITFDCEAGTGFRISNISG